MQLIKKLSEAVQLDYVLVKLDIGGDYIKSNHNFLDIQTD